MKLDKRLRPEDCASREYLNDQLYNISVVNNTVVASNGHILIAAKVEMEEHDKDGLISTEGFKYARKLANKSVMVAGKKFKPDELKIGLRKKREIHKDGASFTRPLTSQTLKNYTSVIPKEKEQFEISFNPHLLEKLVSALGNPSAITLKIIAPTKPIKVYAHSDVPAIGLLMPVRASEFFFFTENDLPAFVELNKKESNGSN